MQIGAFGSRRLNVKSKWFIMPQESQLLASDIFKSAPRLTPREMPGAFKLRVARAELRLTSSANIAECPLSPQ